MKQQLENGDVSPKDYFTLLSQQMVHDRQLFALFKQEITSTPYIIFLS